MKINLPTVLTKETWFYEQHKDRLEEHLGKPYISYSTVTSFNDYFPDFVKQKLAKIKLPDSPYSSLGNFVGQAVETGKFPEENPYGFEGQENINLDKIRPEGAEYERLVIIDFKDYIFVGFIDVFKREENGVTVIDLKTGGKGKEDFYKSDEYKQLLLYCYSLEEEGEEIGYMGVYFVRRLGSHIRPPLKLSKEQFPIPLKYTKTKARKAVAHVKRTTKEIHNLYKTYTKIFE